MEKSQRRPGFLTGFLAGLLVALVAWHVINIITLVSHTRWWRSQVTYWDEADNMAETGNEADHGNVMRVVDGDTLVLYSGEKIRLIGVDTPESSNNAKLKRDAERTGTDAASIIAMGKEASDFTRKLVDGNFVKLERDVEAKDRYGRTLAYVYAFYPPKGVAEDVLEYFETVDEPIPNSQGHAARLLFVNATLIKAGYAQVMTIPPNVKYQDLFVKLEKEARENKRGLWK